MLGKRTSQTDLFESDQQYLHFVGEDTFYGYLARHRHELFGDEDFSELYCLDNGRTSVPPSILACALILQWYDNVSDEEAAARATFDVRWKVALGVELMRAPFAKSVLCEFRNKLIIHKEARKLFEMSLSHARRQGFFKSHKITLALDTTPILGKGAVRDTYNMLAESLRQLLDVLSALENRRVEEFALDHGFQRYVGPSFKGTYDIDWDNESERQGVLEELVTDCNRGLHLAGEILVRYEKDSPQAGDILRTTALLERLLIQDIRRSASGQAELIRGVTQDRIVSVHDPEMRHGRKSLSKVFNGYKGSLAVDTGNQIITAVDVITASAPDSHNAGALIEQSERATSSSVTTVLGDGAYGTVDVRLEAQDSQRMLVAPLPQPPQTGRFSKNDFVISPDHTQVTCPAGCTTTRWFPGTDKTKRGSSFKRKKFTFSKIQCGSCSLRQHCLGPKTPFRTVTVHEHEALLHEAREFQRTALFRHLYRKRVVAEHRIARLVQLGLRKARYFGSRKVLFQLAMTAAVANLTLVATTPSVFVAVLCLLLLTFTAATAGYHDKIPSTTFSTYQLPTVTHQLIPRKTGGLQLSF
jgi:hypothetical protein